MKNAVFLDRDGNINRDVGYPATFESIHIYPYSFEAVNKLNSAGLLAVIITNQSGIGRGLIKEQNLQKIHKQMIQAFSAQNARIDGIYYCPHYTCSLDPKYKKDCSCRKPKPEMALKAAKDLNIDLSGSYMVGDKVDDLLFGLNIGAKPVLVLTGYGKDSLLRLKKERIQPVYIAKNLLHAVDWILSQENYKDKIRFSRKGLQKQ